MAVGRADRRGPRRVYSYQWLENLIGCQVRNAGKYPDGPRARARN